MLQPKRTKFRKKQKGRVKGLAQQRTHFSLRYFRNSKSLEPGWITSRQIEAARIAVTRAMKREGQVWIRIFPDKPVTKKPAEVRMGKGKGAPEYWVAVVKTWYHHVRSSRCEQRVSSGSFETWRSRSCRMRTKFTVS